MTRRRHRLGSSPTATRRTTADVLGLNPGPRTPRSPVTHAEAGTAVCEAAHWTPRSARVLRSAAAQLGAELAGVLGEDDANLQVLSAGLPEAGADGGVRADAAAARFRAGPRPTVLGLRAIRRGDIATHRRRMLRTFAMTYPAVTLRPWLGVLVPVMGGDSRRRLPGRPVPVLGAQLAAVKLNLHRRFLTGRAGRRLLLRVRCDRGGPP